VTSSPGLERCALTGGSFTGAGSPLPKRLSWAPCSRWPVAAPERWRSSPSSTGPLAGRFGRRSGGGYPDNDRGCGGPVGPRGVPRAGRSLSLANSTVRGWNPRGTCSPPWCFPADGTKPVGAASEWFGKTRSLQESWERSRLTFVSRRRLTATGSGGDKQGHGRGGLDGNLGGGVCGRPRPPPAGLQQWTLGCSRGMGTEGCGSRVRRAPASPLITLNAPRPARRCAPAGGLRRRGSGHHRRGCSVALQAGRRVIH